MTKSESKLAKTNQTFSIFGCPPSDSIFLPVQPFSVRNDCQAGQWKVGDADFRGNKITVSILSMKQWVGSLGKTEDTLWVQLFFVPAPECKTLPENTVCVTYLKSRSISAFFQRLTEVMRGEDPGLGFFEMSFEKHSGATATYYSVKFDYKSRQSDEDMDQLNLIANFMETEPVFQDLNGTRSMINVDDKSPTEIEALLHPTLGMDNTFALPPV